MAGTVLIDLHKALMEVAVAKTPGWDVTKSKVLGSPGSGQRGYLEKLLPDGLHLSGEAYQVLWELVKGEFEIPWPGEGTAGYSYPEWRTAPWETKKE